MSGFKNHVNKEDSLAIKACLRKKQEPRGPSEAQIQKKIIDYLESLGAYVFKTIKVNRSGVADVICCLNGAFMAFEVKAAKGRPSPLQVKHVEYVREAGGLSEIVYSLEEVKECLRVWNLV